MDWIEVTVSATGEAAPAVSHILFEAGAGGLVELSEGILAAFLPDDSRLPARLDRIRRSVAGLVAFGLDPGEASVRCRRVAESSWAEAWKEHFHPLKPGKRVVIRPSWRPYDPEPGEVVIDLDPGMAFGTGYHPTTSLCLRALEDAVERGAVVFDVGTGSGILAIAAARLGAGRVVACDIDRTAVDIARANAAANGVAELVVVVEGGWERLFHEGGADLAVANIVADVIIAMAPDAAKLLRPGGKLYASGVVGEREAEVAKALADGGLDVLDIEREGEWSLLVAARKGDARG